MRAIAGALALTFTAPTASAQPAGTPPPTGLQPGEAFVTRFSGTTMAGQQLAIDLQGKVGSIIDLRTPGTPAIGAHWIDEPQRAFVTAGQVGQIFGVAFDDATPPNIYVTATSAFGLHLAPGGREWMAGQWGQSGGPGTIYRLDAASGYQPRPFATIGIGGRPNTGAALGNIAFDRAHRQLIVSDLETGLIHRIRVSDGADLGTFDHGRDGRAAFTDAMSGQTMSLPPVSFDPTSRARIANCPDGPFERTPSCWNLAPAGRRVWGVGVWRHPQTGQSRVYYGVWTGPEPRAGGWNNAAEDDKRVAIWSVGLGPDGGFDPRSVRREFQLPDFFVDPNDVARKGYSHPVSDITFSQCGERPIMLVAERGGWRNLGLGAEDAFAYPHEARALRYELDAGGNWRPVGRYDVGFYERREEGAPHLRANCAGGIAFGPGMDLQSGMPQPDQGDQTVWITGDYLCSRKASCNMPAMGEAVALGGEEGGEAARPAAALAQQSEGGPDDSEVHGVQGGSADAFLEVLPEAAFTRPPAEGDVTSSAAVNGTWLVDTDINIDENGGLIEEEVTRNDATRIGDIAIYQVCAPPAVGRAIPAATLLPLPGPTLLPPVTLVDHPTDISHARVASHGTAASHNRYGSHNPYWSHSRWRSHSVDWSHHRHASHDLFWSHNRWGSHGRRESHSRLRSHARSLSHWQVGSHSPRWSHARLRSHNPARSHSRGASHQQRISHARLRSHHSALSHSRLRSHARSLSHAHQGSHTTQGSHARARSHNFTQSHSTAGSHIRSRSHAIGGSHSQAVSHARAASHTRAQSQGSAHLVSRSHARAQSGHATQLSSAHGRTLSHSRHQSHNPASSAGMTQPPPHVGIVGQPPRHTLAISRAERVDRPTRPGTAELPAVTPPLVLPPGISPTRPGLVPPPRTQPPRVQPPRTQPPRVRPPQTQPPRVQPPRAQPPRVRPPQSQPPRVQPPRVQPPRVRPPQSQPPRVQPPRAQPPRVRQVPRAQPPRARPPTVQRPQPQTRRPQQPPRRPN